MHAITLDNFNTPDSIEWRHRRYVVKRNGWPRGNGDLFLIWDRFDQVVAEVPSLQSARRWIDAERI